MPTFTLANNMLGLWELSWNSLFLLLLSHHVFGEFRLTVLHTNDNHARIGQINVFSSLCSPEDIAENLCYGGVARRLTKINEFRNTTENILLLDGGDQYQGTVWFSYFRGWEGSHFMNRMGYDAMTLGNHEFNDGIDGVLPFLDNATFPILCANMNATMEPRIKGKFQSSVEKTVGGQKIGIIGYSVSELKELVDPRGIANIVMLDELEEVRKEAQRLKANGTNIIIALGHSGFSIDKNIAESVEEIDMVVGAHSHTFLYTGAPPSIDEPKDEYPVVIERVSGSKALVVQAYAFGKYLGHIDVVFDDKGKIKSWTGSPILLDSSIPEDASLAAEVAQWQGPLLNFTQEAIGETHVYLDGSWDMCREYECNLGNVIADAVLRSTNDKTPEPGTWARSPAAFWNSGSIRASIEQGVITVGHIMTSVPYQNTIDLLRLNGSVLWEVFEHSASRWGEVSGRFLQVSGFKVIYDVRKPSYNRVKDIYIRCVDCVVPDYEPLEMDQIYPVVTNNFVFVGGDGYHMLESGVQSREPIGVFEDDSLRSYIKKYSPLIHGIEGRITFYEGEIQVDTGSLQSIPNIKTIVITLSLFALIADGIL